MSTQREPPKELWVIVDNEGALYANHFDYTDARAARRQAKEDDAVYPGDSPHLVYRYVLAEQAP